jgi:2,4-didehydro-3-deoxy-L-rhamnonate hydrolase
VKLATLRGPDAVTIGVIEGDHVRPIPGLRSTVSLLSQGPLTEVVGGMELGAPVALRDADLLPPVWPVVRNVFCVGLNFRSHVEENRRRKSSAGDLPDRPGFFTKATTTVAPPYGDVPLHAGVTAELDAEVELAVVIGSGGRDLDLDGARAAIAGYTVANDISARDLQREPHGQWFRGKSLDGTCPMGPWLVTADELGAPERLILRGRLNGEVVQEASTEEMLFPVPELVSHLSQGLTLLPGDVLLTGTPAGVGLYREPQRFLREGDVIDSEIEGIGTLRNRIALAPADNPAVRVPTAASASRPACTTRSTDPGNSKHLWRRQQCDDV